MFRYLVFAFTSRLVLCALNRLKIIAPIRHVCCKRAWLLIALAPVVRSHAVILWNDPDTTLVHDNRLGTDILGGAVKRDDSANDTLYFKFHVDPISDMDTEEYLAAFELF